MSYVSLLHRKALIIHYLYYLQYIFDQPTFFSVNTKDGSVGNTGWARLIRSLSSARFSFKISNQVKLKF